ncbi:amidohydrolase [Halapricum salinum]|uniref:Amidohydrolase n=1 Tax=Halapricum salinum TaxID=1457250 RepID=A0A4D6H837_9EURY|nr:amidohydrolase [Halapricum salinum]QCC49979.1 amidohydrolase [Halapricum salinum]
MSETIDHDRLVGLRREFHRHPEPAWREFYTTVRIVEECRRIGVDRLVVGPDLLVTESRTAVPDDADLEAWLERARQRDVDLALLDRLRDGQTGAMAVLERGEGPTVALRVDIDALPREESTDDEHLPAAEGFRAETPAMHACGHDAHATIGLGVLEAIANSDFRGTFKVVFQPAEEVVGGGRAIAKSGHLDDVDYLFALHIGLDHPTGEVVAGIGDFLAVRHFRADFRGESAHAGANPQAGRNAVQAMATAVQNLYAIPRHEDGATRINAGDVGGGSATNIVPEDAYIEGEVRGETDALMEYMSEKADRVLEHAAAMHDCEVSIATHAEAPSAESDEALVDIVAEAADDVESVTSLLERAPLGGSEDATFLMQRVQERGGLATYVGIGTDHPGGHHTATFDVDEPSLSIGVDVLSRAILRLPPVE